MKNYYAMVGFIVLGCSFVSCQLNRETMSENKKEINTINNYGAAPRVPEHPVLDLIAQRWSPRAMSGQEITHDELMSLFEAARWAPSSYNNQPWRFIYVTKKSPQWQKMFDLMVPFNQSWAKNAAVLVLVLAHNFFEYNSQPSKTSHFETGGAMENLALEAYHRGLVVHGMEGFDYDRARLEFNIPDDYAIQALYVIGKSAPKEILSEELQEREVPSDRKKVSELISEGVFGQWPRVK